MPAQVKKRPYTQLNPETHNMSMQQYFNDARTYGAQTCGASMPNSNYFTFVCNPEQNGQGYLITAKGSGNFLNYNFTIDNMGNRITIDFPGASGLPVSCWIEKPGRCVN